MKLTLVFMIMLFTNGCTFKKLAIQNADQLIYFYSVKRLPLNKKQKTEYKVAIKNFIKSNRNIITQELEPLLGLIDLKDIKTTEIQYHQIEDLYLRIAGNFSQILSLFLAEFDGKQQEELFKNLNEENSKIHKRIEERGIESIKKNLETFIGELNEKQIGILSSYSSSLKEQSYRRLEKRKKLHETIKLIYDQKNPTERKAAIQEAFIGYQNQSIKETNYLEIIKNIIPTLTDKQIKHFKKLLKEIKEIIQYL